MLERMKREELEHQLSLIPSLTGPLVWKVGSDLPLSHKPAIRLPSFKERIEPAPSRNNLMYQTSWISVLKTFLVGVIGLLLELFSKHGHVLD